MTREEITKVREDLRIVSNLTDTQLEAFLTMHNFISPKGDSINNDEPMDIEECIEKNNEKKVLELLKQIGVPFHIKGYDYLKEAVLMMMEDPNKYLNSITKRLYPEIAKKYDSTSSRVERAIRHAIEVAWDRGDMDMHNEIFGYTISRMDGKPKNSEAIAGIAKYIKMYM